MSVESKSDLSASELKAKRKEEKRKLKEAKKEKEASDNLDEVVNEQSEKKLTKSDDDDSRSRKVELPPRALPGKYFGSSLKHSHYRLTFTIHGHLAKTPDRSFHIAKLSTRAGLR